MEAKSDSTRQDAVELNELRDALNNAESVWHRAARAHDKELAGLCSVACFALHNAICTLRVREQNA